MGWVPYVLAGLATGVLSGIFGIGGGIILVPILVAFFSMNQATASGTSLVALLLPVGGLGVWEYYRAGKIDHDHVIAGLAIAVGIAIGTFFGARFAMGLPELLLRRAFAVFLIFVAVRFWTTA